MLPLGCGRVVPASCIGAAEWPLPPANLGTCWCTVLSTQLRQSGPCLLLTWRHVGVLYSVHS